jgi:hypothetical protein
MAKGKLLEVGERIIAKEEIVCVSVKFAAGDKGTVAGKYNNDPSMPTVLFDRLPSQSFIVNRDSIVRVLNEGTPSGLWKTKDGTLVEIVKMSDSHIANCLKYWYGLHDELIWSISTDLNFMRGVAEERGILWNDGKAAPDPKLFVGVKHKGEVVPAKIMMGDRVVLITDGPSGWKKGDRGEAVTSESHGSVRIKFEQGNSTYDVDRSSLHNVSGDPREFKKGDRVLFMPAGDAKANAYGTVLQDGYIEEPRVQVKLDAQPKKMWLLPESLFRLTQTEKLKVANNPKPLERDEGFVGIKHTKCNDPEEDCWFLYQIENGAEKVISPFYSWESARKEYHAVEGLYENEPDITVNPMGGMTTNGINVGAGNKYEIRFTGESFASLQMAKKALKKLTGPVAKSSKPQYTPPAPYNKAIITTLVTSVPVIVTTRTVRKIHL